MWTVLIAAAVVLGALVVAALVFVVGMRSQTPAVINSVRRLARATKWLPLKSAGRGAAYASVVVHTGRTSGRRYRTPVRAVAVDGCFVVALPSGSSSDRVRNVLAAGGATMLHQDRSYTLDQPRLVPLAESSRSSRPRTGARMGCSVSARRCSPEPGPLQPAPRR